MITPHERRAASIVGDVLADAFTHIHDLHEQVVDVFAAHDAAPSSDDLACIAPHINTELRRTGAWWAGMGFIAEPGVLSDHDLWLEWWHRASDTGVPVPLRTDLRPTSLGFYDYPSAEWFAVPRAIRCRHTVGPYVDAHGTARYVLTLTEPVLVAGRFRGVVGADLPLAGLEAAVLPALAAAGEWAVVNAEGRVVLATTSTWLTGARMQIGAADAAVTVPGSGWVLVRIPG